MVDPVEEEGEAVDLVVDGAVVDTVFDEDSALEDRLDRAGRGGGVEVVNARQRLAVIECAHYGPGLPVTREEVHCW